MRSVVGQAIDGVPPQWDNRVSAIIAQRGVVCTWDRDPEGKTRAPHRHIGIEIVYCERGEGQYYVAEKSHPLQPGAMLIFPANLPHFMDVDTRFERWKLCFLPRRLAQNDDLVRAFAASGVPYCKSIAVPQYYNVQSEERARLRRIFQELKIESNTGRRDGKRFIQLLLEQLAILINRKRFAHDPSAREADIKPSPTTTVREVASYIDRCFAQNITIDQLADRFHYTPGHLWRQFKDGLGLSPTAYIKERRISESKKYLVTTDLPISAIAHKVGYRHPSYFAHLFRKNTGLSPREYRAKHATSLRQ